MQPYTKPIGVDDLQFYFGSQAAIDWYDPIKPYTKLEYEWVRDNVKLKGQLVMDVGAHHGHYAILFAKYAEQLICVEPDYGDIIILNKNMKLNDLSAIVFWGAIGSYNGMGKFEYSQDGNGKLSKGGTMEVEVSTLKEIMPKANVIKVDIEGNEYDIFPDQIDEMKRCHTWIIECHPQFGNPDSVIIPFIERGFDIVRVDREQMKVVPYVIGSDWKTHATIIGRKHAVE